MSEPPPERPAAYFHLSDAPGEPATPAQYETAGDVTAGEMADGSSIEDAPFSSFGPSAFGNWTPRPTPYTYFQADALWLQHSRAHQQTVLVNDALGGVPALTTVDTDFRPRMQPGAMFTLGYKMDPESAFEATYWGLQHYSSNATVTAPGSLSLPGLIALRTFDFLGADSADASWRSNVHNAELNYRQTLHGLTTLAGFRYMNINEEFNVRVTNSTLGTNSVSDYNIKTNNNLFGGQLGVGLNRSLGRLNIDFLGKAGVFGNVAYQTTFLGDLGNTRVLQNFKDNSGLIAFVGELGLTGTYSLTNWFAIRGGYRVFWLDGIALAPNQVAVGDSAPDAGTDIKDRSSVILHGPHMGFEARW